MLTAVCDVCKQTEVYEQTYSITIYNRNTKMKAKLDICHSCAVKVLFDKVNPKWQITT